MTVSLPPWAERAFDQFEPKPHPSNGEVDGSALERYTAVRNRFLARWASSIRPERWRVPVSCEEYVALGRHTVHDPREHVQWCILTAALECAFGPDPARNDAGAEVGELDRLNGQIFDTLELLGTLFRQRQQLIDDHGLRDVRPDMVGQDDQFCPVHAVLEVLDWPAYRHVWYRNPGLRDALVNRLHSRPSELPTWADLADVGASRLTVEAWHLDDAAAAAHRSPTNKQPTSMRLRAFFGEMDSPEYGFRHDFLLGCLSQPQIGDLVAAAYDLAEPPSPRNVGLRLEAYRKDRNDS